MCYVFLRVIQQISDELTSLSLKEKKEKSALGKKI